MNVSKQTGWTITGVTAVLFGCASLFTCAATVISARPLLASARLGTGLVGSGFFINAASNLCTSVAFLSLPVVFYLLLVAGRKDEKADEAAKPED